EVDVAHPGGGTPPEVRLAADRVAARPFPFRARRRRVGDAVLPHAGVGSVLALDVVVAVARLRIAEPSERQVVRLLVIAEVLCRIAPAGGGDRAPRQNRL